MNLRFVCIALLLLGATALVQCGNSSDNTPGFTDDAGADAVSGGDGSSNDVLTFGDSVGDGASCPVHCSTDLHQIIDCNNQVRTTCPPDQGCAGGMCVPACDAAKDNKSTIGCDYYAVNPDTTFSAGACFAAFVANTWTSAVTVNADYNGMPLNVATMAAIPQGTGQSIMYTTLPGGQIPAGQIAILFLGQFGPAKIYTPACPASFAGGGPIVPGISAMDPAPHGTVIGSAFHISTTAPVVAYDIFPYGGGVSAITSATLLLPTTAWDTNYVAVDAYKDATGTGSPGNEPFIGIVAATDATSVTILPSAVITPAGTIAGGPAQMPETYMLNKGQVLQFTQGAELTGSVIQSTNPVGVWGGNQCMDVPVGVGACDAAHQQIPPVKALGHEYVAVRYRNRYAGVEESPPWHIVGAVKGTTLTYEPTAPPGAPAMLDVGQVVEFMTNGPFVVKSQDDMHPFYLASYMTGCSQVDNTGGSDCRGDPEFVNVIPPQQYLDSYVFFTDPTYPETNLVVVRTKQNGTFSDVNLDCAGNLTGWQPLGTSGNYEYTRIDLVTGNFMGQNGCDNGRHLMKSNAVFGLTVWAWGSAVTGGDLFGGGTPGFYSQFVSYGYPAGASVQPINTVVVPPTPK